MKKIESIFSFGKLFLEIRKRNFDALFYLTTRNRTVRQVRCDVSFLRLAGIKKIFGTEYLLKNILDANAPKPLPFVETEKDFLLSCLKFEPKQV